MINKQKALEDFGYQFLGPMCSEYFYHLRDHIEKAPSSVIMFLAREGYFFKQAYDTLISNNLIQEVHNHYLPASRTFLFRISIADPNSWQLSFSHNFSGSLKDLLVSRFGFTENQITPIFSQDELLSKYELPNDIDRLSTLLSLHLSDFAAITAQSRSDYISYIASLNLPYQAELLMVDIGYSGTIQKLITRLLNVNTKGLYFITTKQGQIDIGSKKATFVPVFEDGVKMGDGYTMLDRSLFLESLLTSPKGQFIDLYRRPLKWPNEQEVEFLYGREAYSQLNFNDLNAVFTGAISAIVEYMQHNIRFSKKEIDDLYELYTSKKSLIPAVAWPLFDVDDAISGNANVNPMSLFRL